MWKVASYNMRKAIGLDRRRRPERTLEVLRELDADVIALQEADRRFGTRASAIPPGLIEEHSDLRAVPLSIRALSIGWHGNAVLVRRSAQVTAHDIIHLPAFEPRGAVLVELRIDDAPLRVVGMHLDLSGLWRRRQATAILAQIETRPPMPTVLMGDLNEWSATGGCLRDFGKSFAIAPCGRSFHTRRPVAALDRIMIGGGLAVVEAGVHRSIAARHASDHFPVWARIAPA